MNSIRGWKNKPFWIRLFHWEYWSFHTVYLPIYPVFILLCLRARSFFFYAAANPKIKNGGFLAESKKDIYALIPPQYQPKTLFFSAHSHPGHVLELLETGGFQFPLIGKPDIGGRGRGVKKLEDSNAVRDYVLHSLVDFHIQEFVPYENEAGIFYYRMPDGEGQISGIVHKEFLKVTGNGVENIRQHLQKSTRAILQLPQLEKTEPGMLERVLPKGELLTVVPYGNHARGAMFTDESAGISDRLVKMTDHLCRQIPDFYFGRLDIRYESRELLEQGKSFYVLEVNGAGSEPTHIYDPGHSLFFAWKEIIRHWLILYQVSRANHHKGYPYLSLKEGIRMFGEDKRISKKLDEMQNSQ